MSISVTGGGRSSVLDWNELAQGVYASLGATPQDEWTGWRLTGAALRTLGAT